MILANRYDCALAVVTAQDGAWAKDPFAASPLYELIESKDGEWRIYRREVAATLAKCRRTS